MKGAGEESGVPRKGKRSKRTEPKTGEALMAEVADFNGVPDDPEPGQDVAAGDKTPAWAAWLKRRDPKAYDKRYEGRRGAFLGI